MTDQIGQFELLEEISRSSTTTVYKAYQSSLERTVLLKQLHPHLTREEDIVKRFEREAKAAARIKNQHVVDIYDYGRWEDTYYIAMEYVEGTSLKRIVDRDGPLPIVIATTIFRDALKGMAYAHSKGVFHRDVKPANILLSSEGTVKIADFGLALISDYPAITAQEGVVGTPAYMSPEQAGGEEIDGRSDIFSLGLTFFEMLAGKRANDGESFSACITRLLTEDPPRILTVREDVPKDVADVLDRMLKKPVSKRYQTCDEIVRDLERCSSIKEHLLSKRELAAYIAAPQNVEAESIIARPGPKMMRRRSAGAVVAFATLLLLFIGGYLVIPRAPQETPAPRALTDEVKTTVPLLVEHRETTDSVTSPPLSTKEDEPRTEEKREPTPSHVELSDADRDEGELPFEGARKDHIGDSPATIHPPETGYGLLEINCRPWADVYIDNRHIDTTPLQSGIRLAAGPHKIVLVNPDFPPYVETVDVQPDEAKRIEVSLFDVVGFLDVKARPWAAVLVDGDSVDTTPLSKPLMMSAGAHTLRLENPNFGALDATIEIAAGETLRVSQDLTVLGKE